MMLRIQSNTSQLRLSCSGAPPALRIEPVVFPVELCDELLDQLRREQVGLESGQQAALQHLPAHRKGVVAGPLFLRLAQA